MISLDFGESEMKHRVTVLRSKPLPPRSRICVPSNAARIPVQQPNPKNKKAFHSKKNEKLWTPN